MFSEQRKNWRSLDTVLLLSLIVLAGFVFYRVEVGLEYRWNWGAMPQYLFYYKENEGWQSGLLLQGLFATIRLSVWSLLLALPFGLIAGLLRTSLHLFNRLSGGTYVALLRNIPPLVLVLVFYYFISDQFLPMLHIPALLEASPDWLSGLIGAGVASPGQIESFVAAVVTLALIEGAYIGEIVRAGINAVGKGQWEAAAALGMRRWQALRHIILPQAFRKIVPPLTGQVISTIKDSAIVSVISIQELTFQGMELMAATYRTFELWIVVTVMYFLLTYTVSILAGRLEARLAVSHQFRS
ncbi:MAG: amino acid ABC transporter permease [Desulfuromonas sp.]|nr:MAG: amino acid ABC transporter permease [Desulfuromonas sp.]